MVKILVTRKWGPRFQATHIWISFLSVRAFSSPFLHVNFMAIGPVIGVNSLIDLWSNQPVIFQLLAIFPALHQLFLSHKVFGDMNKVRGLIC